MTAQNLSGEAKSTLTKLAAWIHDHNIPFLVTSIGMIVMLLWAGAFKMTAAGAEAITPLVSNSSLISWHFKVFGPYVGSDIIGVTEVVTALLLFVGYFKPKAGILGGLLALLMFFITSSLFLSTPGTIASIPGIEGMKYMSFMGLFLFKDIIAFGASLFLLCHYGKQAILQEKNF